MQDEAQYDQTERKLLCKGAWDLAHLTQLKASLKKIRWPASGEIIIDGSAITKMDSAGAWLLIEIRNRLEKKHMSVNFEGFSETHQNLLKLIDKSLKTETKLPTPPTLTWIPKLGKVVYTQWCEIWAYFSFIGLLTIEALRIGINPRHWRWNSLVSVIYRDGYQALPIIALLSFMIGVVIAYQLGLQLRNYGADVYIVDLLGLSILREFGPLITSIMVAGRTGSSFTAQIGTMKINQEVDALNTMGVTPAELLLLPRIGGLFISLPLLTMWANIFGVLGGMLMANHMLGITWYDFLYRFSHVIKLKALIIGLGKAPVFALLIATIGCYEGMMVRGSADSVGRNTTRSVVLAIFFIIVTDAIFSVIFSRLKL